MKARARRARAAGWLVLVAGAVVAAPRAASAQGAPAGAPGAPVSAPGAPAGAEAGAQGAPAGAQGAPAGAPASQASRDADAAFLRGKELYRLGKLDAAYEAYRTAWSLKQSYDIAANLANTELQRGMKIEAAEHLAFCLRSYPATGSSAQHEQIRAQFRAVRKEVGSIVVRANVDGAEVFFDGKSIGRTPFRHEVFVQPGTIVVEARLAGHEPARVTLDVPAGATNTASLALLPPLDPPAPPAPPPRVEAPALVPVRAEADTGGPRSEVLVAGGVAAGAGVVAGVVLAVLAGGRDRDADVQRQVLVEAGGPAACAGEAPGCGALRDTLEDAADLKNAALWTFVGAGAVGLATGAYAIWGGSASRPGVAAAPVVTARGGALVIRGTW
ncbi:PEGA domain-containing protein [Sorangium sp. So ce1036]|uniref:PEGA domain-containing protein n=1 Tax=Sorangium sp. So ce1036 TaxID=3133328 RepID=UPI003F0F0F6D